MVDKATETKVAGEKLSRRRYDLVLVSSSTPSYGIDLLVFLKKSRLSAIKLFRTGFPRFSSIADAFKFGADAAFSKPVDPDELLRVIDELQSL